MKNTTIKHWGRWIDSETPVTGVLSINKINWDTYPFAEEICSICEDFLREHKEKIKILKKELKKAKKEKDLERVDELKDEIYDMEKSYPECDSLHWKMIGSWTLDTKTKEYYPTIDGEYSAIVGESTVQVVLSKTIKNNCNICSPCFPRQVDLDSSGEFRGYDLPDYLYSNK